MPVDEKKRRFLKHLGIIAVGVGLGMGLTKLTAKSTDDVVESYADKQIEENKKFIWEKRGDLNHQNMMDYQAYLVRVNGGKTLPVRKTGAPVVNEVACAYHLEDASGEFHEGVYCTAPCEKVCPVDVIHLKDNEESEDHEPGDGKLINKKVPTFKNKKHDVTNASGSECIGCGKCFRICGYNAIHWVNTREEW